MDVEGFWLVLVVDGDFVAKALLMAGNGSDKPVKAREKSAVLHTGVDF